MTGDSPGRQGGDLRDLGAVGLDLSTCVNPYGPPDAVLAALRQLSGEDIRRHPYGAADEVEAAYAQHTGQPAGEFLAGRGTSDLIWLLARHLEGTSTGLPLPAYTEFRRAFPQARRFGGGPCTHPAEILDQAMHACDTVLISNPHNPTGQIISRADLCEAAARHPGSLLVADESYIDFLADQAPVTLIGCGLDNVIVLRSPSKFFGLAGARSGAAWSARPFPAPWRRDRTSWPVSSFAATALRTALNDRTWAARTRQLLAHDAAWLQRVLPGLGLQMTPGKLHFRLLTGPGPQISRFADHLQSHAIAVRVLEDAYGAGGPAARITAPPAQERPRLKHALRSLREAP